MVFIGRTDLASESRRAALRERKDPGELPGVQAQERQLDGFSLTSVEILDERGAALLGKPVGHYYTLELPERTQPPLDRAAGALASVLRPLLPELDAPVCVAALGNPDITPDGIGPLCASQILVTRHLKEQEAETFQGFRSTVLCRTGVLGTSGLESADQVSAFCRQAGAGLVLAVDALAGCELEGLCRSIQICDTGIAPGSGVGNDRHPLNQDRLGIPVLAIGVPTVIDASSIGHEESLRRLFVTPRDIDAQVRCMAKMIAYGINLALHPGLTTDDLALLLG